MASVVILMLAVLGCGGDDDATVDGGSVDADSMPDTARSDAGRLDASIPDAGQDASVAPAERCDGLDDDGDGQIDEGADCLRSFGAGADGDLTVTGVFDLSSSLRDDDGAGPFAPPHRVTAVAGTAFTVQPTPMVVVGDEVLLLHVMSSAAGEPSTTGRYETAFVSSVDGDSVSLASTQPAPFDGSVDAAAEVLVLVRIPRFGTVSIESSGVLTTAAFDGNVGGLVFFRADTVAIAAGGRVDVASRGFRGGGPSPSGRHGTAGESFPAPREVVRGGPPNGGGGGGGRLNCDVLNCTNQLVGGGGAGAGYGADGTPGAPNGAQHAGGQAGMAHGEADLSRLFLGSGGGGGAGGRNTRGVLMPGGNGGGAVVIAARALQINGSVHANGQIGSSQGNCMGVFIFGVAGGGGGGSGGSIWLIARDLQLGADSISAVGGPPRCGGGGVGGVGRIRFDYSTINGATFGEAAALGSEMAASDPDPGHRARR